MVLQKTGKDEIILELEIYKILSRTLRIKLKVLVDRMVNFGFKKVEVYNTIKWKLSNPIKHPTEKNIWGDPMLEVVEEFENGKVTKIVRLNKEWVDVDEKSVEVFFTGNLDNSVITI